jgi:hypothetical protein
MRLRAGEEETLVRSVLTFSRTPGASADAVASPPLELAGSPEIVLRSLSLNGAPLPASAYARTPKGGLLLHAPLPDGAPFTLSVETALKPQANTSLEGLYKSSGACTRIHARRMCTALCDVVLWALTRRVCVCVQATFARSAKRRAFGASHSTCALPKPHKRTAMPLRIIAPACRRLSPALSRACMHASARATGTART